MPNGRVVYIGPNNKKGWSVKSEGAQRALRNFDNKKNAVYLGRQVARKPTLGS